MDALRQTLQLGLGRHDQDTSHLTSVLPLAKHLPVRLTDAIDLELQLYNSRVGTVYA